MSLLARIDIIRFLAARLSLPRNISAVLILPFSHFVSQKSLL